MLTSMDAAVKEFADGIAGRAETYLAEELADHPDWPAEYRSGYADGVRIAMKVSAQAFLMARGLPINA